MGEIDSMIPGASLMGGMIQAALSSIDVNAMTPEQRQELAQGLRDMVQAVEHIITDLVNPS